MASRDIIVGLDLGTTKVTTIIAEVDDQGAQLIGLGHCESQGMQRGVVINIEKTVEAIKESVLQAERMAGLQVESVIAGIAGDHIHSMNSKGVIAISRRNVKDRTGEITQADVDRVVEAAKAVNLPMDREVLHVLPQEFAVDDQKHIKDPIGMAGVRLEADVHIITGQVALAQNIYRCVERAGMRVRDLVLEPLASSYSVISEDERDIGVGLLDMGGGTSDIAVFHEGSIRMTSVIGLGGENVTRDLSIGLRTPFDQAERIKLAHGHCYLPNVERQEEVEIPGIGGRPPTRVSRQQIAEFIQPRMEELFELAMAEMRKANVWEMLNGGIVLTGGASEIEGAAELAQEIFELPVKVGQPTGLGGLMETARSPIYATGVGLVLYGLEGRDPFLAMEGADESTVFRKILRRMRAWFEDFF
ncbi:cell division protein FtsA [bacterium]|nr:cell division protein FtsA [bacterium]